MAGLGDDAVSATTANMGKLLQLLIELLKLINESRRHRESMGASRETKKQPKVRFGEMKFSEYKKLLESGEKMHTVSVPAEKLSIINEYSKKIGAAYFTLETGDKTATVVVPERYFSQFNDALKMTLEDQLSADKSSLVVKDGGKVISEDDIDLVRTVLEYHDIPVYSFKNADGSYMNIVPTEYDGQYESALNEVKMLKEQMQDIDIDVFEQTLPFAYMETTGERALEITAEQAEYLAETLPDKAIRFIKDENGVMAARFKQDMEQNVTECLESFSNAVKQSEDYKITVVDSSITVNKAKLLVRENENEYFTRVPNTDGKDYIWINKNEAQLMDGGKTIGTKLDYEKTYKIYDKNGNLKSECPGRNLGAMYNTKSRNANKDTDISHYHNDSLERVELYNSKDNKLISIGIVSAETMRINLEEQGITGLAAEKMLADIDRSMPPEYRAIFNYTPRKQDVSFEEVQSSIIHQYTVEEKLRNCEMAEGNREILGNKCCVLDKNSNKYVMIPANEKRVREALESLGYDKLHINAVMSEVQKSFDRSGAQLERESVQVQSFDTNNAEIGGQYQYCADDNGITIIKSDIGNETAAFKYLEIEKDTERKDIEAAIKSGFDIRDSASVAALVRCMDEKGLISPAPSAVTKDGFEVSRVTSDHICISKDDKNIVVNKDNVDKGKLCETFGIDERSAEKLKNSLERSLKAADKKPGMGQTLSEIKAAAKKGIEKINAEKKEAVEKPVPKTTSER